MAVEPVGGLTRKDGVLRKGCCRCGPSRTGVGAPSREPPLRSKSGGVGGETRFIFAAQALRHRLRAVDPLGTGILSERLDG